MACPTPALASMNTPLHLRFPPRYPTDTRMILRVTKFGEPVLHEPGVPIREMTPEIKQLARDMLETMIAAEGVGLAAQQVDRRLRLFVVDLQMNQADVDFHYQLDGKTPPLSLFMPMVIINPVLEVTNPSKDIMEEGCLSFPGIRGDVKRPAAVRMSYTDLDGASHEIEADGFLARVFQHEYDHIEGTLFNERMPARVRKSLEPEFRRLKHQTRRFLENQPNNPHPPNS